MSKKWAALPVLLAFLALPAGAEVANWSWSETNAIDGQLQVTPGKASLDITPGKITGTVSRDGSNAKIYGMAGTISGKTCRTIGDCTYKLSVKVTTYGSDRGESYYSGTYRVIEYSAKDQSRIGIKKLECIMISDTFNAFSFARMVKP